MGGGNTVRNITACFDAGVCKEELFDVSPYAVALTEFLVADPQSFRLPRKYKIAFSGCSADCAGALANDLGFIARMREGERGFAAYVGGGMGSHSRLADPLEEFVPADEIHLVAEAVKRVFDKHGNRKNKHQARLRFLIEGIGLEKFKELYATELAQLRKESPAAIKICEPSVDLSAAEKPADKTTEGFSVWRQRNVRPQKQDGYFVVRLHLFLGDINADLMKSLAKLVEAYGEGMLRTTQSQDLVLRWVHETELPALHPDLARLGLEDSPSPLLRDSIACAGAATCKLGLCLSRGLTRALRDELHRSTINLEEAVGMRLHINGCPNACGRHPLASIGFVGAARRVEDRLVPSYIVKLGGRMGEGRARFAEGEDVIPARSVPAFLMDFLRDFQKSLQWPDFDAFLDAEGRAASSEIAAKYKHVPPFAQDKNFYYDWGAEEPFSLAARGPGECSAGVFDLIEIDLQSAREAFHAGHLRRATELAARTLLITRGEEVRDSAKALSFFEKLFIDDGLVDERFRELVQNARESVLASKSERTFTPDSRLVEELLEVINKLYENMGQSLQISQPAPAEDKPKSEGVGGNIAIDKEADLRGVTCPLNYVKTKMFLEGMNEGQVLSVVLDEEGCKNVPPSAEKDGHKVLSVAQEGTVWRVIIEKGKKS